MKVYRAHVSVPGLPDYTTLVVARSHKVAESLVPNPLGGKVRTVLLKGAKPHPLDEV